MNTNKNEEKQTKYWKMVDKVINSAYKNAERYSKANSKIINSEYGSFYSQVSFE